MGGFPNRRKSKTMYVKEYEFEKGCVETVFVSQEKSKQLNNDFERYCDKHVVDVDKFPDQMELLGSRLLQNTISEELSAVIENVENGSPVTILRGLSPREQPASTPYDGVVKQNQSKFGVMTLLGLIRSINFRSYAYESENNGKLLRAVCPKKGAENEVHAQSTKKLGAHIDGAFRPLINSVGGLSPAPHLMIFWVERNASKIPMQFVGIDQVVKMLPTELVIAGFAPEFQIQSGDSWNEKITQTGTPALFMGDDGLLYCKINLITMKGMTKRAKRFINSINNLVDQTPIVEPADVSRGDLVVLNNVRSLHLRSAYQPNWDGNDRFLIRSFATRNLDIGTSVSATNRVWK